MEYTTLGTTGVQVSRLCLGTMMFGAQGNTDVADCTRIIHAALDAGINFVDTADVYGGQGGTEEIVGAALAGERRQRVVLATKGHFLDLYQLHRPDPRCDIDETLGVLSDLVREGKIHMIGTSGFSPAELVEAQWVALERGRERFVSEQPQYSILVRAAEAKLLPAAERHRLGVMVWSPLAGGWLAGKYRAGEPAADSWRRRFNPGRFDTASPEGRRKAETVERLQGLASDAGLSLVHLALRFVLEHRAVSAAIIGPRTLEQLEQQATASDGRLDPALLDAIDALVAPGTVVNPADLGTAPQALGDARLRRRPP